MTPAAMAEPGTAALRRSLFEALAGSEAVGVAVCDRDFRYLLWNRFIERYPAQLPGITDWGLAPIDRVLPPDLVRELEASR